MQYKGTFRTLFFSFSYLALTSAASYLGLARKHALLQSDFHALSPRLAERLHSQHTMLLDASEVEAVPTDHAHE